MNELKIKPEYYETFYEDMKRNHDMLWDIDQKMLIGLANEIREKFGQKGKLTGNDLKLFKHLIKSCEEIRLLKSWVEGLYLRNEQNIPEKIRMELIKKEFLRNKT